jgi:hypothetical protein
VSQAFQPFYADYEPTNGTYEHEKGRYLILGLVMNPVMAQAYLLAAYQAGDGRMVTLQARDLKFRGFLESCLMCQWPRMEGERT